MSYEELQHLSTGEFKRLTGVKRSTFLTMVEILQPELERQGKRGGQNKLSVSDQLLIALAYWREYRTYFHIAQSWGLHESTVYRIVRKVETILLSSGQFSLPSRQDVRQNTGLEVVVIDVTEIEVERPKKTTTALYRQAKMSYPLRTSKAQLVVDASTRRILATAFGNGRCHDFRLYKETGVKVHPSVGLLADKGYQGIKKHHANSTTPFRKLPRAQLTSQ